MYLDEHTTNIAVVIAHSYSEDNKHPHIFILPSSLKFWVSKQLAEQEDPKVFIIGCLSVQQLVLKSDFLNLEMSQKIWI